MYSFSLLVSFSPFLKGSKLLTSAGFLESFLHAGETTMQSLKEKDLPLDEKPFLCLPVKLSSRSLTFSPISPSLCEVNVLDSKGEP